MRSFRKLVAIAACGLLVAATGSDVAGQDAEKESRKEKREDRRKERAKSGKKSAGAEGSGGQLSLPILEGHDALGLKIPYHDTTGKLQMLFNIGRASRIDANNVKMGDLQLETYDEQGGPEMTIEVPTSVLNLSTKVITTDTNVTIRRVDFEITGRSMEFNTETKQGKLVGDVRMLIYDLEQASGAPAKEEKVSE